MSNAVYTWAEKQKTGNATAKAVLLILADHADREGFCFPKQATIAEILELSERAVRDAIRHLEGVSLIQTDHRRWTNSLKRRTNAYRLQMPVNETALPAGDAGYNRQEMPVNETALPAGDAGYNRQEMPVKNHQCEPSALEKPSASPRRSKSPRARDPIWDTLAEVFWNPGTDTDKKRLGRVRRTVVQETSDPAEIKRRADLYHEQFPDCTLTPEAFEKHFGFLGTIESRQETDRYRPFEEVFGNGSGPR